MRREYMEQFSEIFGYLTLDKIYLIIITLFLLVSVIVVERILRRSIRKFSKKAKLEKHLENILVLIARILVYSVAVIILLSIWGLPVEWFVSVSALSGAAIGFASTQTLGNLLAGIYIMISRPFLITDFIKIGNIEGEVNEITLNYVKIFVSTYTFVQIPNRIVLNSTIHRMMTNGNIDYSFTMSFAGRLWSSSWISIADLIERILKPKIEEFWEKYNKVLPKKPEVSVSNVGHMNRTVLIRTFFHRGKARLLYDLLPELQLSILSEMDKFRDDRDK